MAISPPAELPFTNTCQAGADSESCGLPMWCHQMNATHTPTHTHKLGCLHCTFLQIHCTPSPLPPTDCTVYDKYSRWIHSSRRTHFPSQAPEHCRIALAGVRLFMVSVLNQNTVVEISRFSAIMQLISITLFAGVNYSNSLCRFTSLSAVLMWGHLKLQQVLFSMHLSQWYKWTLLKG